MWLQGLMFACIALAADSLRGSHDPFGSLRLPEPHVPYRSAAGAAESQPNDKRSPPPITAPRAAHWPPLMADLVLWKGYPLIEHWVGTGDGYLLQVYQIPAQSRQADKGVVLLMHGLLVRLLSTLCASIYIYIYI